MTFLEYTSDYLEKFDPSSGVSEFLVGDKRRKKRVKREGRQRERAK